VYADTSRTVSSAPLTGDTLSLEALTG